MESFEVVQGSIHVATGDGEEEIDFVARFGKTIIIGECKCSVQPAEPVEFHNYFDTLRKAVGQARKKAKFIENNSVAFLQAAGISSLDDQELRTIPVVITNLPLGVGYSFNGVPVTDVLVFSRFVEQGEIEHEAYVDRSSGRTIARSKTVFYASEAEAQINLARIIHGVR